VLSKFHAGLSELRGDEVGDRVGGIGLDEGPTIHSHGHAVLLPIEHGILDRVHRGDGQKIEPTVGTTVAEPLIHQRDLDLRSTLNHLLLCGEKPEGDRVGCVDLIVDLGQDELPSDRGDGIGTNGSHVCSCCFLGGGLDRPTKDSRQKWQRRCIHAYPSVGLRGSDAQERTEDHG